MLVTAAAGFGAAALLAAVAPSLPLALAAFIPLGAVSVTFAAGVNSTLQLGASPTMRGRVMAIYSVVFIGSTPIGGPIVGWLAEVAGPRAGLVLAGVAALVAAAGGWYAFSRRRGAPATLGRFAEPALARLAPVGLDGSGRRWRAAASPTGRGRDTGPACGSAAAARTTTRARRRSARRRAPRSPRQRRSRPRHASATRIAYPAPIAATCGQTQPAPPTTSANRPIGHRRPKAIRPGLSAGRLVAVRAPASTRAVASRDPSGAPEPDPDRRGARPPDGGDREREGVGFPVRDHDAHHPERRRHPGDEQDRASQQVAEEHQRSRSRSRNPSTPETTRSASR